MKYLNQDLWAKDDDKTLTTSEKEAAFVVGKKGQGISPDAVKRYDIPEKYLSDKPVIAGKAKTKNKTTDE